jgi:hypothetical protein
LTAHNGWRLPFIAGAEKRIRSLLKTKAFDNTPNKKKNTKKDIKSLRAFLCILKIKKICPQLIALLH